MHHKRGIYHYMQKIILFAAALVATLSFFEQNHPAEQTNGRIAVTPERLSASFEFPQNLPAVRCEPKQITEVIPGGDAVAVRLNSQGVIILGFTDESRDNPGRKSGLKKGDRIVQIGESEITSNDTMTAALNLSKGNETKLRYVRGKKEEETTVVARQNSDGNWQLGLLVKDSTAGIGTLTYVVPQSGEYGSLGHGISDPDTETLFCIGRGDLYPAEITAIRKGESGAPGELQGMFGSPALGNAEKNTERGLFGLLDCDRFKDRDTVPVAAKEEVREGDATIRCTLDDEGIREYSIQIVHIYRAFSGPTKNMLIRVTDPALLEKTGGIVQGMSGSPILQNGKIVGAVTHVLVNDAASGYGIFIENMLSAAA